MKVVFFGTPYFVKPVLQTLKERFEVVGVVNKNNNLTVEELKSLKPDLFVVAAYGKILPNALLSIPHYGSLNIHPSLLSKYRGPTPVQTAILNGEKETGVTIIKLDEQLDHGPILVQTKESILPNDTAQTLHERLFKIGADLLGKNIDQYVKGSIKLKKQNDEKATYTKSLTRTDGYVDISKRKAQSSKLKIERMIRAYHPWPGVWTKWKMANGKWKILKFLPNQKLQVEGGKPMSYKDFINGYPEVIRVMPNLFRHLVS